MMFLLSFLLMSGMVALRLWRDRTVASPIVEALETSESPASVPRPLPFLSDAALLWASAAYVVIAVALGYAFNRGDAAIAVTLAYLFVGTWTDLRSREVYLPLTIASMAAVIGVDAMRPDFLERVLVAGGFTTLGVGAYTLMRGRSFGLADILAGAVVFLGFGPVLGGITLCYAVIIAAGVGVALIIGRLASRKTALPMFPFIALGAIVLQAFGVVPRLALGGLR